MKTLYQCNPELFEKCKKTLCQEECTMTTFEKYAKRNEFGKPIIAMNDNMSVAVDKTLEQEQKTDTLDKIRADIEEIEKAYGFDKATKYGNKNAEQQNLSYSTMLFYEIAYIFDDIKEIIDKYRESEE